MKTTRPMEGVYIYLELIVGQAESTLHRVPEPCYSSALRRHRGPTKVRLPMVRVLQNLALSNALLRKHCHQEEIVGQVQNHVARDILDGDDLEELDCCLVRLGRQAKSDRLSKRPHLVVGTFNLLAAERFHDEPDRCRSNAAICFCSQDRNRISLRVKYIEVPQRPFRHKCQRDQNLLDLVLAGGPLKCPLDIRWGAID